MDCSPPGFFVHGILQGKNTGVGSHSLLWRIFPTQGSNPGLLHYRWILYCLNYQESPGCAHMGYILSRPCPFGQVSPFVRNVLLPSVSLAWQRQSTYLFFYIWLPSFFDPSLSSWSYLDSHKWVSALQNFMWSFRLVPTDCIVNVFLVGKNDYESEIISYWEFLKRILCWLNEVMRERKQMREISVTFFVLEKILGRQRLNVWKNRAGAK